MFGMQKGANILLNTFIFSCFFGSYKIRKFEMAGSMSRFYDMKTNHQFKLVMFHASLRLVYKNLKYDL